eukprot:7416629-Pyramimonas_sp.AAC.1
MSLVEDSEGQVHYVAWRASIGDAKKGLYVEIRRKKPIFMPEPSIKSQGLEKDLTDATIIHA